MKRLVILLAVLLLVGCAQEEYIKVVEDMYDAPNMTQTEVVGKTFSKEDVIDDFMLFWKRGQYNNLYDLMEVDGYTREEFAFLVENNARA